MATFLERVKRRILIELSPPPTTARAYAREGEEQELPRPPGHRGAERAGEHEDGAATGGRPLAGSDLSGSVGHGVVAVLTGRRTLGMPLGAASVRLVVPWSRLQPAGDGSPDPAVVAELVGAIREIREDGAAGLAEAAAAAERFAAEAASAGEEVTVEVAEPTEVHLHVAAESVPGPLAAAWGWESRGTAEAYAAAVDALAAELAARDAAPDVWFTLVRPWARIVAPAGSGDGAAAPPWELTSAHVARAHHAALGHGLAADAVRARLPEARVGAVLDQDVHVPTDEERFGDLTAVHDADARRNHLLLGPLLEGALPVDLVAGLRGAVDFSVVRPGDLARARARLDVLGLAAPRVWRLDGAGAAEDVAAPTERGDALFDLLRAFDVAHEGLPLVVEFDRAGPGPDARDAGLHAAVEWARGDGIPVVQVVVPEGQIAADGPGAPGAPEVPGGAR